VPNVAGQLWPRRDEGLVDFSRLAHQWAARLNEIERKHGFSAAIEMLDAFRYGKINKPQARAVAV
jgi:hypothetical protein